jgi:hypothetical protein
MERTVVLSKVELPPHMAVCLSNIALRITHRQSLQGIAVFLYVSLKGPV